VALLHSDRWNELESEMHAAELVEQAIQIVETDNAAAAVALRAALGRFHPSVLDPASRDEFKARTDGSYKSPSQLASDARRKPAPEPKGPKPPAEKA
jgi:hypothetical protein